MGKGEDASKQYFLPFLTMFSSLLQGITFELNLKFYQQVFSVRISRNFDVW